MIWMNELSEGNILSLFAVISPQAIKRAFQKKVTNFTRFLGSRKCQFGKAESFSIVEEGYYMYNTASLMLVFIHGHQCTEQYIYIYIAYLRP